MTYVDLTAESAAAGGSPVLGGYLAVPSGPGPFPGVVMIHEAFGLNDTIRRHADRLARAGYLTLAVDLFSDGGTRRCLVSTMRCDAEGKRPAVPGHCRGPVLAGQVTAVHRQDRGDRILHGRRLRAAGGPRRL